MNKHNQITKNEVDVQSETSSLSEKKQKRNPAQLRKIQQLQSLLTKPFSSLTEEEKNKRRILSRITGLIGRTESTSTLLRPINSSINGEPKFTLNIQHTKQTSKSKMPSNQNDSEKEYVDYLMLKKFKQQEQAKANSTKEKLKENYEQLWQDDEDQSDKEIVDTYNVNKALRIVHRAEVEKEKLLKSLSDDRVFHKRGINYSSLPNSNLHSLSNSRMILMQDQDINETECREQQIRRTHKKLKTIKVIKIVEAATKKIYNKKKEQIQKEVIMHQVYKQMNDNKKNSIKSIDSVFRNTQSEETFQSSQNQQKLITNKLLSENKFYLPKNAPLKPIPSKILHSMDAQTEDTLPRFCHRKISDINEKIVGLVSRIDSIQQQESDQLSFIRQMQNEQDLYKTYRQSLQPDQIQDTLKSLLAPNRNNYNKPFRFNNRKFCNQLM